MAIFFAVSLFQMRCALAQTNVLRQPVRLADAHFDEPGHLDATDDPKGKDNEDKGDDLDGLLNLDIDQLSRVEVNTPSMNMEVTSVARTEVSVGKSPAAIFVITNEMIRRSTARSLPELFRMVPGMEVQRMNGNQWSVGVRGLAGIFSNKMLVQIDGRTVYTPIFGGVYWDAQDVLLEDLDRIEIIRGPGATVWGANAVNGIINIITKHTSDTQGVFVEGGAGTEERGFASARIGGEVGETGYYRAWVKWFDRDAGALVGSGGPDRWELGHGGFRMDWTPTCCDAMTFQGDFYGGISGKRTLLPSLAPPFATVSDFDVMTSGGNLLTRWTHTYNDDEDFSVQAYYDRAERHWVGPGLRLNRDTVDVDFQHRFPLGCNHSIIWGLGYRNNKLTTVDLPFAPGAPPIIGSSRPVATNDRFSGFIQDTITLEEDRWFLTLGSKLSGNDFTGFEYQPTARLLWTPTPKQSIWGAVSRAVRTPTFSDDAILVTSAPVSVPPGPLVFPRMFGSENSVSEELLSFEVGMRAQPSKEFYWDIAGYYFRYDNQRAFLMGAPYLGTPPTHLISPITFGNGDTGSSYGFELAANYEIRSDWRIRGHYTFNRVTLESLPNTVDPVDVSGSSPRNQVYFQSSWDLCNDVEFDVIWRWSDQLPSIGIGSYNTMDVRLAWMPADNLEFALVGRNLLTGAHAEMVDDTVLGSRASFVERELYGVVTWRY